MHRWCQPTLLAPMLILLFDHTAVPNPTGISRRSPPRLASLVSGSSCCSAVVPALYASSICMRCNLLVTALVTAPMAALVVVKVAVLAVAMAAVVVVKMVVLMRW